MSAVNGDNEAPVWLQKLEDEREKRLKSRLGHEIGAGAKCIECKDICPGLDLHFWRKICKNCKCSKESHDVNNYDNLYGWVHFQLLGDRIKIGSNKVLLCGRNAPVELDWVPKGSNKNVSQYLNEISPDLLPVKGSKGARIRQQNLQKQIPAYDVDSSLCHDLSKEELDEFDDYLNHLKNIIVGQGNVVELELSNDIPLDRKFNQLTLKPNSPIIPIESEQIPVKYDFKNVYPNVNNDNNYLKVAMLPKCAECNLEIEDKSIAIEIERADCLWHPKCFKCYACHQLLVDLMYFFSKKDGHIYCGRDYAQIKGIPRCLACDELIFSKEYCCAENSMFHVKHFCCFLCDIPLAGLKYVMDDNQPICLDCFNREKANVCRTCHFLIPPDQQGVMIKGCHWHLTDQCFQCFTCKKSVIGLKVLLQNEQVFCSKDCFV